jgi:hypothetical protein
MPERIQRKRVKGWRMPPGAVYVGRPTRWGNPFAIGGPSGLARVPAVHYPDREWEYEGRISAAGMRHDYHHPDGRIIVCHVRHMTPEESVQCYRAWIGGGGWPIDWSPHGPTAAEIRAELAGCDLVCWCPLHTPCHADVLLEVANA